MMYAGLTLLGILIGGVGTLIGAGGGFVLMPVLVLLYPHERPETLASISLAVVALNAASGSIGYARQKKIDYRSGWLFIAMGIPGAIVGALVTSRIPRQVFDLWLGSLLAIVAMILLIAGAARPRDEVDARASVPNTRVRGGLLSLLVGFISSLLGIGGGIIHVPGMVYVLRFPVHLAAGTSHFVLAFTALTGTAVHIANGEFHGGVQRTVALGVGAVIGAQVGSRLAKKTPGTWILRVLALALGTVGVRVVLQSLQAVAP